MGILSRGISAFAGSLAKNTDFADVLTGADEYKRGLEVKRQKALTTAREEASLPFALDRENRTVDRAKESEERGLENSLKLYTNKLQKDYDFNVTNYFGLGSSAELTKAILDKVNTEFGGATYSSVYNEKYDTIEKYTAAKQKRIGEIYSDMESLKVANPKSIWKDLWATKKEVEGGVNTPPTGGSGTTNTLKSSFINSSPKGQETILRSKVKEVQRLLDGGGELTDEFNTTWFNTYSIPLKDALKKYGK